MSHDPNSDALLDALRRVGVVIPDATPITVRSVEERKYWYVECGPFDTFVDGRDASNQDDALVVAYGPLQNWYVRGYIDKVSIRPASKDEYLEWLQRGVR